MEHKPRMEPGGRLAITPSPLQQQQQSAHHRQAAAAANIKEERPEIEYEASLNCRSLVLAETGPPAESMDPVKWQRRRSRRAGRDHRRYYQERWKMEYLMDYDCLRHGLVCMVCGSTLATLKLSTIKRHILQKHQDTMFLTRTEKEVVIATWIDHLLNHSYPQEKSDTLAFQPTAVQTHPAPVPVEVALRPDAAPVEAAVRPEPSPARGCEGSGRRPGKPVRRYYQERWRSEYLMDYDCLRNGLVCMVCGSALATLKLSTIKRHILQKHRASLGLSPSQRDVVMAAWVERLLNQSQSSIQRQGAGPLTDVQSQPSPPRLHQSHPGAPARLGQSGVEQSGRPPACQGLGQSQTSSPGIRLDQSQDPLRHDQSQPSTPARLHQSGVEQRGHLAACRRFDQPQPGAASPVPQSDQSETDLPHGARPDKSGYAGPRALPTRLFHQSGSELQPPGAEPACRLRQSEIEVELDGAGPGSPTGAVPDLSDPLGAGSIVKVLGFSGPVDRIQQQVAPHSPLARLSSKGVRRYYQQRWRVEHLMDYDWWRHGLVCMVCGKSLATLTLSTIKRHILQNHPHSLNFNQAERENILEAWNERALQQDCTAVQLVMPGLGPSWSAAKRPRCHYQERWRFEYLMDYDRWWHTLVCMVCGKSLATVALSTIKRHILQNHPHSLNFSQAERENILEAWSKTTSQQERAGIKAGPTGKEDISPPRIQAAVADIPGAAEELCVNLGGNPDMEFSSCSQLEWDVRRDGGRSPAEIEVCVEEQELSSPTRTVRGRVPGRDHWRNYQERWRLEYLMDYDQGRHGLVCMVCGSTLATLKLSTIKRHILQKHQHTMGFTLAEKVMVVEEWNKKVAAIAKMDFWQLPTDGNGCPPQHHPGIIISSQH